MRDCGFDEVEIDAVGNVVGRYRAERSDAATLMTGSHYDTVRNGGKYDGRLGIFVPMACVRELHRQGRRLPYHLEVIGFAEEEGQRYAATFLGSGALVGDFRQEWLDQRDAQGITMREAMQHAGLCIDDIPTLRRDPARYLGFVEVHIEQGPVLFEMGLPLGVVTSINGSVRYRGRIVGMASHAGTTPWTAGATRPPPRPSWPCTWSARERRRLGRHHGHAGRPTARSTWCPANAASAWTCARRQRQRDALATDVLAELAAICQRRGLRCELEETLPPPRPARPPGRRAGNAVEALGLPCTACPAAPATTP